MQACFFHALDMAKNCLFIMAVHCSGTNWVGERNKDRTALAQTRRAGKDDVYGFIFEAITTQHPAVCGGGRQ